MPKLRAKHHSAHQSRETQSKRFEKKCGCEFHDDLEASSKLLNILQQKQVSKQLKEKLIEKKYIQKWTKYICESCINKATKKGSDTGTATQGATTSTSPRELTETDACGSTSKEECPPNIEFKELGSKLGKLVKEDSNALYHDRTPTLDDLLQYNCKSWLSERPPELVEFLSELCGLSKFDSDKKSYLLAKVIEHIYHVRCSRVILPLSFRENVLLYSLTTSKNAIQFCGNVGPSGSYRSLIRCLEGHAETPIKVPDGTLRCTFDNNQVIGKTYIIKGENKVPSSVMCSTAYIKMDDLEVQKDESLKPSTWMWRQPSLDEKGKILVFTDKYKSYFRETRDSLLSKNIIDIKSELSGNNHIDNYLNKMSESKKEKLCVECGGENDGTYRFCRNCGGQLIKPPEPKMDAPTEKCNPYLAFSTIATVRNNATVIPGEPQFLNPNSFETIVKVLQELGKQAEVTQYGGTLRSWVFVECDGLPYKIMRDLIDNVWHCKLCNKSLYGLQTYHEHMCHVLHGVEGVREFSWIFPVMGQLHLEMNAARSFLKLNWTIFMSRLAYVLGFKSDRAQQYCLKGSDHHKTWHLLQIAYLAFTKELLVPYIQDCAEIKEQPTVDGYWKWSEDVKDPNYSYVQQMTFTYLHGLMLFRSGIRKNNVEAIFAGRAKFSSLFYAQHHPKYQAILFRDMVDEVLMPEQVRSAFHSSYTASRTAQEGCYQGGDACLEEINKDAKSWLKHTGVPNNSRWLRIFRSLDKLKKLRDSTMADAHVPGQSSSSTGETSREISSTEVALARAAIRQSGYLSTPKIERRQINMDGTTYLNPELLNFTVTAEQLTSQYVQAGLDGNTVMLDKVCVTLDDLEDSKRVENMTVTQIKEEIFKEMAKLTPEEAGDLQKQYHNAVKSNTKKKYVDLYYEVVEEIELRNMREMEELSSDDDDE